MRNVSVITVTLPFYDFLKSTFFDDKPKENLALKRLLITNIHKWTK